MKRWMITLALLASYPLIAAGSCATTREARIRTVEVKVPVVTPCPDKRDAPPAFPDTDAAVAAAVAAKDLPGLVKMLLAGRTLHYRRHAEDDAQVAACAAPPLHAPA